MTDATELDNLNESGDLAGLSRHVVDLENVGPLTVFVDGDLEKLRLSSNIFLSIHDVGTSYQHWVQFNTRPDMIEIRHRSLFLHVSLPGQRPGADDLASFPSLENIGISLVNILDSLRIPRVLLMGDGAGAYIALKAALQHPSRVHGVVLVNCSASGGPTDPISWVKDHVMKREINVREENMNMANVEKYEDSYHHRTELLSQLSSKIACDVLLVTGSKSNFIEDGEAINAEIQPGKSSIIKLEDAEDPLHEAGEKVADAVVLFAQGLGLVPTAQRQISRRLSNASSGSQEGDTLQVPMGKNHRRMSMEEADIPNIRRLSIGDTHKI